MSKMLLAAMPVLMQIARFTTESLPSEAQTNWSLDQLLKNSKTYAIGIGGGIITLSGVILMIVAGVQIATGLMSHGKKQTNWVIVIVMLIVGGIFTWGGFTQLAKIASGAQKTIEDLGKGKTSMIINQGEILATGAKVYAQQAASIIRHTIFRM